MNNVFLKGRNFNAKGKYNKLNNELIVLKGSILCATISDSEKFRGAKSIIKARTGKVKDNILQEDVLFKSPSTAGNFVTGKSTNGLLAWKNIDGKSIKEL